VIEEEGEEEDVVGLIVVVEAVAAVEVKVMIMATSPIDRSD